MITMVLDIERPGGEGDSKITGSTGVASLFLFKDTTVIARV